MTESCRKNMGRTSKQDDCPTDPYENTKPQDILKELKEGVNMADTVSVLEIADTTE